MVDTDMLQSMRTPASRRALLETTRRIHGLLDNDAVTSAKPRPANRDRYVLVGLASEILAIPLLSTVEVTTVPEITPIPFVAESVLGVTVLRGEIVSVVSLAAYLSGESKRTPFKPESRCLIVRSNSHDLTCGLLVDRVWGIHVIEPDTIQPVPESLPVYDRLPATGIVQWKSYHPLVIDVGHLLDSSDFRNLNRR